MRWVGTIARFKPIEFYTVRTRERTGDCACTNATGPHGDSRAIL